MPQKRKIRTKEWLESVGAVDPTERELRTIDTVEVLCCGCGATATPRVGNVDSSIKNKGYGYRCAKCKRERLSQAASERTGDKNSFYGKRHSEAAKQKISESKKIYIQNAPREEILDKCLKMRKAALEKYGGNPMLDVSVRNRHKEITSSLEFKQKAQKRGAEVASESGFSEKMGEYSKEYWNSLPRSIKQEITSRQIKRLHTWLDSNPDKMFTSKAELEILSWVHSLGLPAHKFRSQGNEIDILLPSKGIGVEFNGLYWHSEAKKGKRYHIDKTILFSSQGIKIIHIFEHEWRDRKDQVKSFLKSKFGLNKNKIGARKCSFREVEKSIARAFLEKYHIQGSANFHTAVGAYLNDELILVATFAKHHRGLEQTVLNRFVCAEDWTVQGGLSKVSKIAFEKYGELVSWCDLRWSDGSGYETSGWTKEEDLKPDYFYTDGRKYVSKQSRKKSIVGTPQEITELEHATIDGLFRVYDCGKIRFKFVG